MKSGTIFVSPDWPEGLSFLGYTGLLDSIRFAFDPPKNQTHRTDLNPTFRFSPAQRAGRAQPRAEGRRPMPWVKRR